MAKIAEFHTNNLEYPPTHRNVYHDQSECKYGKEIKREHRTPGKGGRKPCSECARLD